jgi:hypothetical protein
MNGSEGCASGGGKEAALGERTDVVWVMGKQDRRSPALPAKVGDLRDAREIVIRSDNKYRT